MRAPSVTVASLQKTVPMQRWCPEKPRQQTPARRVKYESPSSPACFLGRQGDGETYASYPAESPFEKTAMLPQAKVALAGGLHEASSLSLKADTHQRLIKSDPLTMACSCARWRRGSSSLSGSCLSHYTDA